MFSRKARQISFSATIWILAVSVLACQPVIAIGWNEFLVVFLLFAVLLGPLIYRFLRRVEKFLKRRRPDQ
ncbi:MAG TPA: hypothetical protein VK897_27335 [Anaerolineales bacterium]|nr:hypothetical protein [Anaerolineales bacterium]